GLTKAHFAALSAATGHTLPTWGPAPDGPILALLVSGNVLYVGGRSSFESQGYLNAFNATTGGSVFTWNPMPAGPFAPGEYVIYVDALAENGGVVYAGGHFASVGGQTRNNI